MEEKKDNKKLMIIIAIAVVVIVIIALIIGVFVGISIEKRNSKDIENSLNYTTGRETKIITNTKNKDTSNKAKITTNDGKVVYKTASELVEEYKENEANFEKQYLGAKIEFDGVVKQVATGKENYRKTGVYEVKSIGTIIFDDNWVVKVTEQDKIIDLSSFENGARVTVTSYIVTTIYGVGMMLSSVY